MILQNQLRGHVNHRLVGLIAYAEKPMDKRYAHVCKDISVIRLTVDQSVYKVRTVLLHKLA